MKMNAIKETICTRCTHRKVCAYKDECFSVIEAVLKATVTKQLPDGTVEATPIENFDFIEDISITCRYRDDSDYTTKIKMNLNNAK